MSLIVEISTLEDTIETLSATRMTLNSSDPNAVNDYIVYRVVKYPHGSRVATSIGRVSHRYGDGAVMMARKMLELFETTSNTAHY